MNRKPPHPTLSPVRGGEGWVRENETPIRFGDDEYPLGLGMSPRRFQRQGSCDQRPSSGEVHRVINSMANLFPQDLVLPSAMSWGRMEGAIAQV